MFEDLTRRFLFHCYSFSDISYTFSIFFPPKFLHMYLSAISYTLFKIIPFCQVPISLIESQTSSFLKYKALYVDGTPDH